MLRVRLDQREVLVVRLEYRVPRVSLVLLALREQLEYRVRLVSWEPQV